MRPLDADFAYALFLRYWLGEGAQPSDSDAALLHRLLERIRYHALLTEMLTKHLRARRREGKESSLRVLVDQLSQKGILGLPRTDLVELLWQGEASAPSRSWKSSSTWRRLPTRNTPCCCSLPSCPPNPCPCATCSRSLASMRLKRPTPPSTSPNNSAT